MFKKIMVIVIAISTIYSTFVFFNRYNVEQKMNTIEIAAEWKATGTYCFQDIANDTNTQFEEIVDKLKRSGVTSIGIHEKTLSGLVEEGSLNVYYLKEIINAYYSLGYDSAIIKKVVEQYAEKIPQNYWDNYMILITRESNIKDFLMESLAKRVEGGADNLIEQNGVYAIIYSKRFSTTEGLGFLDSELEYVTGLGFSNIIARVQNYKLITEDGIMQKITQLKHYGIKTVVFAGTSVLGYSDKLKEGEEQELLIKAAEQFKREGFTIGLIEVPAEQSIEKIQKGITLFSDKCGYQETKLFSPEMKNKLNTIYEQCTRAIVDRKARIIYLKPINLANTDKSQNLEDTYELIEKLKTRVRELDYKIGVANKLEYFSPTNQQKLAIFIGIIAGGILLLDLVFKMNIFISIGIFVLGVLGSTGILFSTYIYERFGNIATKGMALLCAIIFASLASYFLINRYDKLSTKNKGSSIVMIGLRSIVILLATVGIAVVGGIFISALLGDSKYMLKIDTFSGVKVAFILPIIIYVIMFIKKIGIYKVDEKNTISIRAQMLKFLNTSITVKYGLISLLIICAFGFLILRTGNNTTGMMLPFEEQFRIFLEQNLDARPRTKDLLTLPFIAILTYAAIKGYKEISFLIMLIGTIGAINIINTFSHIRMTLDTAIISTLYSTVFGIIVGTIVILLWYAIDRYLEKKKQIKQKGA